MAKFTGISAFQELDAVTLASTGLQYGTDKLNADIQKALSDYSSQQSEMMSMFAERVEQQSKVFDASSFITVQTIDQYGKSRNTAFSGRWEVGFVPQRHAFSWGCTKTWLGRASLREIDAKQMAIQTTDYHLISQKIGEALYTKEDVTLNDETNGQDVIVRRAWNASNTTNQVIPPNSSGSSFDISVHQHYNSISGSIATATEIDSYLISNISEHDENNGLIMVCHSEDVADLQQLSQFTSVGYTGLNYGANTTTTTEQLPDNTPWNDRLVGRWRGTVPVMVKPFAVQGYLLAVATDSNFGKPLGFREMPWANERGLRIESTSVSEPLIANEAVHYFGLGALNRSSWAVLQLTSGAYSSPTFTV